MNILLTILLAVQILSALTMIGLILMQHGKGADAGAAFGGGGAGSASLFGASGGANFMSRSTAVLAAVFLTCTLGLAYFGNLRTVAPSTGSVLEGVVTHLHSLPTLLNRFLARRPRRECRSGTSCCHASTHRTGTNSGQMTGKGMRAPCALACSIFHSELKKAPPPLKRGVVSG